MQVLAVEQRKKVQAVYDLVAEMRGRRSEDRFFKAWRSKHTGVSRHYNQFIVSVEPVNMEDDMVEKTDARVYTLLSKQVIPIQIKSSIGFARSFLHQCKPIPVVVIGENDTSDQIRRRTIFEIVNMFPYLGQEIEEAGCNLPKLYNYFRR